MVSGPTSQAVGCLTSEEEDDDENAALPISIPDSDGPFYMDNRPVQTHSKL